MESKVRLFGHPVHQMLIVFPLGLLGMSIVFDLLDVFAVWEGGAEVAYALISAGILAGLVAAPFGTIDWLAIPRKTRAKKIGALHGATNVLVLLLFGASWWLRQVSGDQPTAAALALSFFGVALALIAGWLGGELVDRLGIGVSPYASVDARSSLDGPALPAGDPRPNRPA